MSILRCANYHKQCKFFTHSIMVLFKVLSANAAGPYSPQWWQQDQNNTQPCLWSTCRSVFDQDTGPHARKQIRSNWSEIIQTKKLEYLWFFSVIFTHEVTVNSNYFHPIWTGVSMSHHVIWEGACVMSIQYRVHKLPLCTVCVVEAKVVCWKSRRWIF